MLVRMEVMVRMGITSFPLTSSSEVMDFKASHVFSQLLRRLASPYSAIIDFLVLI